MPRDVQDALRARGHTLFDQATSADSVRPGLGDAQAVMIDPATGMRLGASDARRPGLAVGY
ncbi:MAG TPA: gamma-glutamyltransferase, partial [Blastocatellia bacterium]|nr:gamma-glutamyltransferase [Blastocatellia bacterium]